MSAYIACCVYVYLSECMEYMLLDSRSDSLGGGLSKCDELHLRQQVA